MISPAIMSIGMPIGGHVVCFSWIKMSSRPFPVECGSDEMKIQPKKGGREAFRFRKEYKTSVAVQSDFPTFPGVNE